MTKIIRLESSVSEIHLLNKEKGRQNKQEEIPDILEFNLDGQVVHFVKDEQVPLKNGDQCIVAGYLRENVIQTLALKHIETGHTASADTDKMKREGFIGVAACTLGIIVSLILLSIVGLSDLILFIVFMLLLVAATACLWVIKKFVFDEAALIEKARKKI